MKKFLLALTAIFFFTACQSENKSQNELWIYTSLYKDTIADLTPILEKQFPGIKFNWFQAGSEEIATKVNAEILAGNLKADILISSDRFWYEDMARNNKLMPHKNNAIDSIPIELKNKDGYYSTLSIPVMVLAYNNEAVKNPPKTFKELAEDKWKDQFTTGSPLASGTNFTTMAMLQFKYGWEYFRSLKKNNVISQGGNSAVVRRLQNKERTIGWVLLENLLRFQDSDDRIKVIYPEDGVVTQANVIAIVKKENVNPIASKFVDFMYTVEGQKAMTRSYMYSPLPNFEPPKGALTFETIFAKSFKWSDEFINSVVNSRENLKEEYTKIMFE